MLKKFYRRYPLAGLYIFFLYFSAVYQFLIVASGTSSAVGLRQAFIMSTLWLVPILLWPTRTRALAAVFGVLLWATSTVSLGYWLLYGQDFSQSTIFVLFESNVYEGGEFIASYFRWDYVAVFAAYSAIPIALWRNISPPQLSLSYRGTLAGIFAVLVLWPYINGTFIDREDAGNGVTELMRRLEPAAPWNLVFGYVQYRTQLADVRERIKSNESRPPLENLVERNGNAPRTLVLVIGESTNRQRMGLYGYPRETTPNLSRLRDDLLVFDNVVTPRPFTIEALQQVLSFAMPADPAGHPKRPPLLNLMRQAGYEITWITNQQTQTARNTMLTALSQMADHHVYLNNNRRQDSYQFDGAVLQPFAQALESAAPKKMIIVHLLGTHRKYTYRYPKGFDRFTGKAGAPAWVADDILAEYNSYDNAVLYNDYVVSELIKTLDRQAGQEMLLYFADHGEEVYDTPGALFSGRNESKPTPAMYTVPFVLWGSREFFSGNQLEKWKQFEHRPYGLADFIYTWSEVAGLDYASFDYTRSLVSDHFIERPRWIGDPAVPDSLRDYAEIAPHERRMRRDTPKTADRGARDKPSIPAFMAERARADRADPARRNSAANL